MYVFRPIRIGLLSLALLIAGSFVSASAQVKVGVVNLQKAILDTAEIKKASSDLEAKYKPRQDEGQKVQKQLQDIQAQLANGAGKISAQQEADLQSAGQRRQRELQRLSDDLQADVDRDRNEILKKASDQMQAIVRKMADDKGLDIVVDASTTVYFKTALDLTAEATTAYNAAHPTK